MDTLLQPFPYNNEYRANREKLIEELKTYIRIQSSFRVGLNHAIVGKSPLDYKLRGDFLFQRFSSKLNGLE